jgi:crossover junction endodeoxyribonuclease RuvC
METVKTLACDLSLTGSALAVLIISNNKVAIEEIVFVDNKKNSKKGIGFRLNNIAKHLTDLLNKHKDIEGVVRERGFSKFPTITQTLFRVVGVADLTIYKQGFDVVMADIPPTTVKKLVAGKGKAQKFEVELGVRDWLVEHQKQYEFETDDCSDAVAVGIAWAIQKGLLVE